MKNSDIHLENIPAKFQQSTMELLFGRFQHLVEDIFGQLDGETLFRCSHINKTWNGHLEEYRLYLVKKIQKYLTTPSRVYHPTAKILGFPASLKRNITVEQLPLLFLVQFQKYFCNYEMKDCEVNIRILSVKKTFIALGVFIKNESNADNVSKLLRIKLGEGRYQGEDKQSISISPPGFKIPTGPLITYSIKFMI